MFYYKEFALYITYIYELMSYVTGRQAIIFDLCIEEEIIVQVGHAKLKSVCIYQQYWKIPGNNPFLFLCVPIIFLNMFICKSLQIKYIVEKYETGMQWVMDFMEIVGYYFKIIVVQLLFKVSKYTRGMTC